ncbi:MAG: hypothetical protein CFK49_07325 [Armatimonadetes bacterium JP3_11]|jgi:hypothetical protein|nr:MAG: hypothetical protein CFK49_07325 [Armatimonadetes bacterium JP3_11]
MRYETVWRWVMTLFAACSGLVGAAQCEIMNFEGFSDGLNGSVMFRPPSFSGSTSVFLGYTGRCENGFNCAQISSEQNHTPLGNRSLKVAWQFNGNARAWLRLTTYNTSYYPNPTISFTRRLSLWLYVPSSTPDFYLALGVRETASRAACGANGSASGAIEWVGATQGDTTRPPIGKRITQKDRWVQVVFDIPNEPVLPFAAGANGILDGRAGVLEHLAFTPVDPAQTRPYVVYLDDIRVLPNENDPANPPWIFGMHEPGGEFAAVAEGKRIWILFTEELGADPNNTTGRDYRPYREAGHGVIVRLNYGYHPNGTLPPSTLYAQFAQRVAQFVRHSQGAHIWIIGNETNLPAEWPGGESGEPITVARYVQVFRMCRDAIRSIPGHADDLVCAAPVGTYAPPFPQYNIPGFLDYWEQMLQAIGPEQDGFMLHAYTHGSDPNNIFSETRMQPPYDQVYLHFRVYRNLLSRIPPSLRHLPVFITETNQGEPWTNTNNGWIKNAYLEIHNWNQNPANQRIYGVCLYRWPQIDPYYIEGKWNTIQDWREAMRNEYRWRRDPVGDVNFDGCVDDADLLRLLFQFGGPGYTHCDLNWDGVIDDADLLQLLFNFGTGC